MAGCIHQTIIFNSKRKWVATRLKKNIILSLWNKSLKLGLCGDYFGGPRLENGWQSAHDLHNKIRYGK